MEATKGQGINRVIVAGGDLDTFQRTFDILKVGGRVANVNYLGEGENIKISRESTMVGMGHKQFVGGLPLVAVTAWTGWSPLSWVDASAPRR